MLTAISAPDLRPALARGVAPSIEHDSVPLPEHVTRVLDVGANRGQFALWARRRWPAARIDCFEPLAEARATLLDLAPSGVHLWPVALGDENTHVAMHVTRDDDSSSLHAPTPEQVSLFPGSMPVRSETVEVVRLEEFAGRLPPLGDDHVLLKIDVQGHELKVLRGSGTVLDAVACVYVESSLRPLYASGADTDSVVRFLHGRSFVLRGMFNPLVRRDEVLQADLLFTRPLP